MTKVCQICNIAHFTWLRTLTKPRPFYTLRCAVVKIWRVSESLYSTCPINSFKIPVQVYFLLGTHQIMTPVLLSLHAIMILSFRTNRPGQTVQTQIRVYIVCHSVCIIWTHCSMVKPHSSNFRVITTNCLGVRIFRKFMVGQIYQCIEEKIDNVLTDLGIAISTFPGIS